MKIEIRIFSKTKMKTCRYIKNHSHRLLTVFSSLDLSIELEGDACFCRRAEKGEDIITTEWLEK
jgi:hypothetical protein